MLACLIRCKQHHCTLFWFILEKFLKIIFVPNGEHTQSACKGQMSTISLFGTLPDRGRISATGGFSLFSVHFFGYMILKNP